MDLAWLSRRISGASSGRESLLEKIATMSEMTDDVIRQMRRISAELRPGVLDDLGLDAALEWQCGEFEKRTEITCVLRSTLGDRQLDRELSTAVFRIFQEALTNITRHAEAKHVEVTLEEKDGRLRLEVKDDGKGIAPEITHGRKSLGLLGMRERARRLGGSATIRRDVDHGTIVTLDVPLVGATP
jgi:signal transduction histidine kinase